MQRDALQVLQRQRLVGKGQHLVRQPGLAQPGHGVGRQRQAQVEAVHDGAAGCGLRGDGQRHGVNLVASMHVSLAAGAGLDHQASPALRARIAAQRCAQADSGCSAASSSLPLALSW